ncbi:MAG TPA: hypothetical protein DHU63_06995, partial [Candidatus Marinimicrobia bacterium]|nr:hypothetical protein [Candidatus Neomarinimicrobiota bacterium]
MRKVNDLFRLGWVLLLTFIVNQQILNGGTTGKIAGNLIDAETNEPLIGCNVLVEGSDYLGAASDLDGNYMIIGIPPGKYSIIA